MRIVIVGASGNVGTAVLRRLRQESGLELVGVARRLPGPDAGEPYDRVEWHSCDVGAPGAAEQLARDLRRGPGGGAPGLADPAQPRPAHPAPDQRRAAAAR